MKRVILLVLVVPLLFVSCGIARSSKSIKKASALQQKAVRALVKYVGNDLIVTEGKRPTVKPTAFLLVKDLDKRPVFVSYYKGEALLKESYLFASNAGYDYAVKLGDMASKNFEAVLKETAGKQGVAPIVVPKKSIEKKPTSPAKKVIPAPVTPPPAKKAEPTTAPVTPPPAQKTEPAPAVTPPVKKAEPKPAPVPAPVATPPVKKTEPKPAPAATPPAKKQEEKKSLEKKPAEKKKDEKKDEKKDDKKKDDKKKDDKKKDDKKKVDEKKDEKKKVDYFELYQKYRKKDPAKGGDK